MILCANPKYQFLSKKNKIISEIKKTLNSNKYVLGKNVESFEKEFSKYIGVKFSAGVANGTDALEIGLKALNIGRGDEVITVSHTALATVSAICSVGALPVLVDIHEYNYLINENLIKKKINSRTKAIICVHIYGQTANLEKIKKISKDNNLHLIEDVSQAHGALYRNKRAGSFGIISTFSFYPTKNLGAVGDGGIVCSNNKIIIENIKKIREYGWNQNRISNIRGRNSRLDELQESILRVKLKYLDQDNNKRKLIAKKYLQILNSKKINLPQIKNFSEHVFHLFVIRVKSRSKLIKFLNEKKIYPGIHYPKPIHLQPAYKKILNKEEYLPITEKVSKEILSLPIYPELSIKDVIKVSKTINSFFK
jgi:dTDP-4-amino-4,6-dideoxygalactose transaminase